MKRYQPSVRPIVLWHFPLWVFRSVQGNGVPNPIVNCLCAFERPIVVDLCTLPERRPQLSERKFNKWIFQSSAGWMANPSSRLFVCATSIASTPTPYSWGCDIALVVFLVDSRALLQTTLGLSNSHRQFYNGVWNPISLDASENPKRKVPKYDEPYRWLVPLHLHSACKSSGVERCLKCMVDPHRKQFEFARQSETGKEHLKTCKASTKATELERIFFVTRFLIWA